MYLLSLADGRELKVSEDHLNNVWINTSPNACFTHEERNLTTEDLLKQPLFHTKKAGKRQNKKHLVHIKNCSPLVYPHKELSLDPYVLGLLLGDGSLKQSGSVILHAHKDDMEIYKEYLLSRNFQLGSYYLDKRNHHVVSLSLLGIHAVISQLGLKGIKMQEKFVPETYFYGSIQQRKALLSGLLDTDGSISKEGRITFSNTSLQLCKDVVRLCRSLGGTATLRTSFEPKKPSNKPNYKRCTAYKVELWLREWDLCLIPRKRNRIQQNRYRKRWLKKSQFVGIQSITAIPNEPSQCIGIDSPNHLFVAGEGYVVTHNTGVRGVRAMGTRPKLAILDDLISDEDAKSETILRNVEDTVYKAITHAMHPTRSMIIWSGTPFNAKDPLYKAIESGAWNSNVYPVCEKFPCEESEFRGSWEDRFTYQYVKQQYEIALKTGTVAGFDQELMLRIMSDDDRLISEGDLGWYDHTALVRNKSSFNFYITTDFATSERQSADYSVISVWALNNKGFWYWVDGICARQNMAKNLDDLFRLVVKWNVLEVGIEVSGQQGGFIPWIQDEMLRKNCFFTLASANNSSYPGIKPTTNKLQRFNVVVPWFKQRKVYFPRGYDFNPALSEMLEELRLASVGGFRSKHDDALDTISMLALINAFPPSEENTWMDSTYRHNTEEPNYDSAYIV